MGCVLSFRSQSGAFILITYFSIGVKEAFPHVGKISDL